MAHLNDNLHLTGRLGGIIYYQRNGRTYSRVLPDRRPRRPATQAQMPLRARWGNVVNLWKAFSFGPRPTFEERPCGSTDYNCFFSAALRGQRIYLTRQQLRDGCCIVTPLLISEGTLPEVGATRDSQGLVSDIALGTLDITPDTTLAQLASAIVKNNAHFLPGDGLAFVSLLQRIAPDGSPSAMACWRQITLDLADNTPLTYLTGRSVGFASRNGLLASSADPLGGHCWVHTRDVTKDHTIRSTQRLLCNNDDLQARYSSPEAYAASAQSYGPITPDPLLRP